MRTTTVPGLIGPLLLYSTSPLPAPLAAIDLTLLRFPERPDRLRLVVLQTPLEQPTPDEVDTLHRQFSGHGIEIDAVDPGLQSRDDAARDHVIDTIRSADLVLVTGGDPVRMAHTIDRTPAIDALREASGRGMVIGGGSAGAMCFGAGLLDGPRDDRHPKPLLGWIPSIVIAPHFGNYPIEPWQSAIPGKSILGLPDRAVALVTGNGTTFRSSGEEPFTVIRPGEQDGIEIKPGDTWSPIPAL